MQGDITDLSADVYINAATSSLQNAGGMANSIMTKAGPALSRDAQKKVKEHGPYAAGDFAITVPGNLP